MIYPYRSFRFLFIALILFMPILGGSCGSSSSSNDSNSGSSGADAGADADADAGGGDGGGADAGPPMTVLSPAADQTSCLSYRLATGSKIEIDIQFSKEVDQSSVTVGQSFVMAHEKGSSAAGTITWPNIDTLRFITTDSTGSLCVFDPDCLFTFNLIGTDAGSGAIKDTDGMALDGDGDGAAGGDWTTTCIRIG